MQNIVERIDAMTLTQRQALRAMLDERGEQVGVYPLSSAQRRMWFLSMMYGDSPVYSVPYTFWVTGRLDVAALDEALQALVRRHETLRTVFFDVDGVPYQTIQPDTTIRLNVRRWRPQDADNPVLVQRLVDAEARRTFDLGRGPLLVATVLTAGESADRHLFMLTLHHIVCDGWSMGILFRELETCYAAALEGREADLPPVPVRYVDFARWQAGAMSGDVSRRRLGYWQEELADLPPELVFPGRRERSAAQDFRGDLVTASWPVELGRTIEVMSREYGVTSFMLTLAVFGELLRRRTGASDLVVGTPMAGRSRVELEGVVGFFVNTLPLRIRPRSGQSLLEAVQEIRTMTLAAQEHQEVPLEAIVDTLGVQRVGSENPLFQVSFVVQEQDTETLHLPGAVVTLVHGHGGTAKFDLTSILTLLDDELECQVEYRRALFERDYVRGMVDEMRALLVAALARPDQALDELAGEGEQ